MSAGQCMQGKINALLFSLISMIGYQSAVWWKLGPQEDLGTYCFCSRISVLFEMAGRWEKSVCLEQCLAFFTDGAL
jgi:hypothetical protein